MAPGPKTNRTRLANKPGENRENCLARGRHLATKPRWYRGSTPLGARHARPNRPGNGATAAVK
eukprot:11185572-Lingulodinium_polyedra.AAC.1